MGTTASTAQQTVSAGIPFEGLQGSGAMDGRHSLSVHSFQTPSLHNSKAKSIIPNKVAPVVITYNCKEEFQIHDELLKAHYTLGRLSDVSPQHYLVQGRYFLVRDVTEKMDLLGTLGSCGAPNFRQARGGLTVFGMGQPSLAGFRQVLQKLQKDGHKECIIFCVREEPVLFLRADEDFVSYTPRDKQNLQENLHSPGSGVQADSLELAIRKEIHDFAQLSENTYYVYHNTEDLREEPRVVAVRGEDDVHIHDFAQLSENTYYVYHNTEDLREEPRVVAVRGEDDVHVTEEVYKRPLFLQPAYRSHPLPLPEQGAPLEAQFDAFVSVLRETPSLLLLRDAHGPPPALLFNCQTGVGRTNLGMVLGTLTLFFHRGTTAQPEAAPLQAKPLPMEQFQVIQSFLHTVPQGRKMVEEVDRAISACAELHNLKEVVLEHQRTLEGIRPENPARGSGSQPSVRQRALWGLERYFYLILFNYYLHEQYPLAFALSFSRWLCAHPELYRLAVTLSPAGPVAPSDLIAKGSLGLDDLVSPDALSTVKEMDVANFRRVPRMPIYGMAQPSAKALGSILAYLTDAKRKLRQVVWVNLREEPVLECDGHTRSLRWPGAPALESQLKTHLSVPSLGTEGPPTHRFQSCLTTQEIFSQHRGAYPGLSYHRIPVPDFCAPREEDFDRLLETLRAALAKDPGTGFVFSCLSGQGRTTTAMVVAVLAFWHIQGFPEVGEEELVSVPDAKFTKGEFQVVMKVVQLLPDGHCVKKEVDAALDTVSETMTPMHYHLREIIICTYRQVSAGPGLRVPGPGRPTCVWVAGVLRAVHQLLEVEVTGGNIPAPNCSHRIPEGRVGDDVDVLVHAAAPTAKRILLQAASRESISVNDQAKAAKEEQDARRLQLRSLQYLERYICLILFNAYLHLERADSWQRPFSAWMREVAAKAGVYELLNQLGFPELESGEEQPFSRLRCRWQEQSRSPEPSAAGDFL
ncbi:Paladin [Tupaia chinensis]|uniref:Paladin n=1 Tax=Tupaia chinensis TaxID=246437 RepID=L9L8G8_TUPCH|nr:Paladin [Tupaia chinensis]